MQAEVRKSTKNEILKRSIEKIDALSQEQLGREDELSEIGEEDNKGVNATGKELVSPG